MDAIALRVGNQIVASPSYLANQWKTASTGTRLILHHYQVASIITCQKKNTIGKIGGNKLSPFEHLVIASSGNKVKALPSLAFIRRYSCIMATVLVETGCSKCSLNHLAHHWRQDLCCTYDAAQDKTRACRRSNHVLSKPV